MDTINKEQQNTTTSPRKIRRFIDLFRVQNDDSNGFEKQRKQSIYNLIAFSAFIFLILTIICCYFILQQFLRPLLWAVLFGFVLHPFKRRINQLILNYITRLNDTHRPAIVEVLFLPFNLINYCLNTVSNILIQYGKLLGFIFFALLFIHLTLYYFIFAHKIWTLITSTLLFVFNLLILVQTYSNLYYLLTLAIIHFTLLCLSWNSETKDFLIKSTPIIWIILFSKLLLLFNTLGIMFFFVLLLMIAIGVIAKFYGIKSKRSKDQPDSASLNINISYLKEKVWNFLLSLLPSHTDEDELYLTDESTDQNSMNDSGVDKSFINTLPRDASSPLDKSGDKLDQVDTKLNEDETKKSSSLTFNKSSDRTLRKSFKRKSMIRRNSLIDKDSTKIQKTNNLSDAYLYALVWSCLLAQIYMRPQFLYLLPIPISLYIIKWLWKTLKDTELFSNYSTEVYNWIEERREAIYNPVFCFIYENLLISDYLLSKSLKQSAHSLSSLFVILFVIFGAIFATIFLAFQIYHESALLVELTANVMPTINSTLANDSELGQMLPKNLMDNNVAQELLTKGYLHGRVWLQTTIRTSFGGDDLESNATIAIEKQMLEVFDRIYHQWVLHPNCTEDGHHNPRSFEVYNWDKLFSALKTLNLKLCFNLMKENFDIIFSIFESIWSVLKGNLKLMIGSVWAIVSALLTGSTAILNVSLSLIVFITSLFYLLASSEDVYKPMDMAVKFMLLVCSSETVNVHKFEQAVEDSITSIFTATFKMSFFYGLYTWLILTLSESSIIYIPAVLAALLGAVPFIGAYWAFLPSILEYWLVYSSGVKALLLLLFAIIPSYFVDTQIYSEIKGSHPYLTGLSIAGGVYYFGSIEGCIIGPMILCFICVITKFYAENEKTDL